MSQDKTPTIGRRIRSSSISMVDAALNFNPQPGMWAATGTTIAHAPTINELREPIAGGANIEFTPHGHSARTVTTDSNGEAFLANSLSKAKTRRMSTATATILNTITNEAEQEGGGKQAPPITTIEVEKPTLAELTEVPEEEKHGWGLAILHALQAFWKFVLTPTGFLMTLYGLNIVAWGAMLFFLLLDAAPAMDHPNKDSNDSPRKKWLEIDSQILNALFCVTGFGLAPWRFRDLYYLMRVRFRKSRTAMKRLAEQNKSWFRPGHWYTDEVERENEINGLPVKSTFTGEVAPPTRLWKLAFVVWMMVWNTLFQGALAGFMWGYNRIDRPSWATGTFIGLGCAVSAAAGGLMWWEGRKVKRIEGPVVKLLEKGLE